MTKYPNLRQYFGGYLNQDWRDDYADEWAALEDYLRDNPSGANGFCPEAQALLSEHDSEQEVRTIILDELWCAYLAEAHGWRYRDWLRALSDYAAKAIGHPQAS